MDNSVNKKFLEKANWILSKSSVLEAIALEILKEVKRDGVPFKQEKLESIRRMREFLHIDNGTFISLKEVKDIFDNMEYHPKIMG